MRIPLAELEWEDGSGVVHPLLLPGRHAIEASGLGMPPIRHWTTRSPFQHGESHWGFAWQPRIVNLVLYSSGGTRTCMFYQRQATIAAFNPEAGPGKLRMTYPDGQAFALHECRFNGGYSLSSADGTWSTQIGDLQLRVSDPFWKWITSPLDAGETRDAEGRTCIETSTLTQTTQLRLPFTGPFLLGTTVSTATLTANNDGTKATRPVFTVEGPTDDFVIANAANGHYLTFDGYSIAAAEVVTFDVLAKTITNGAGDNLSAYVGGNFATFELQAGANALTFTSSGSAVHLTTTFGACWFLEMLGL